MSVTYVLLLFYKWISMHWVPISAIANILLAFVTALMAIYTREMAKQSKDALINEQMRYHEEKQRQIESIIVETLLVIIRDIQTYERAFYELQYMSHVSNITAIEENNFDKVIKMLQTYPPVYNEILNLLKYVNVPSSLLIRLLWSISTIQMKYADMIKDITTLISNPPNEVNKAIGTIVSRFSELRLYQVQLGCYIMAEVKRKKYVKITDAIEGTGLLNPTADMAQFKNRLVDKHSAPEPSEDYYAKCKMDFLVSLAEETHEQKRREFMESLESLAGEIFSISEIRAEAEICEGEVKDGLV